jgi:hypothetical protein
MKLSSAALVASLVVTSTLVACSSDTPAVSAPLDAAADSGRGPEQTGQACRVPADCYVSLGDSGTIKGEVQCLDRVTNG